MPESLQLWFHVTRRNWLVYKKDLLANIAPTAIEPLMILWSIGVGVGHYVAELHGRPYAAFLAPGLAVSTALFTAFFESSYGFYVRLTFENIYRAMLTTPIDPQDVVLGEFIWVSLKGAALYSLMAAILAVFGQMTNPWLWLAAPFVGASVALPCGAIGLLASSYVRNINQFQSVYAFFISPLFYFSGIFFPLEQMPNAIQWIAKCLPLYHGVRLSQMLFWNEPDAAAIVIHLLCLVGFAIAFCFWSSLRIRRILRET